jgi:hypothetical protein
MKHYGRVRQLSIMKVKGKNSEERIGYGLE